MLIKYGNNLKGFLGVGINDSPDNATIVITGADNPFPSLSELGSYFYATLEDVDGNIEIVKAIQDFGGNAYMVERGQQGTTIRAFSAGSKVELRLTSALMDELANKQKGIDARHLSGFVQPENVILNYDVVERKVTLTGFLEYYCQDQKSILPNGWQSPQHDTDIDKLYYLFIDETGNASWTDTFPNFSVVLICFVIYREFDKFAIRECHGLQDWQSHRTDHFNIGTYKRSGGDITDITINSTVEANRRPDISETLIYDEDLPTTLPQLTSKEYAIRYLNEGGKVKYDLDYLDIIQVAGSTPQYNSFSSPDWGFTNFPSNSVGTVWLFAVPVTADLESQKRRFSFVQPQSVTVAQNPSAQSINDAVAVEKQKNSLDVNLGQDSVISPEYVAIAKFIIVFTDGNWFVREVINLTGSRAIQAAQSSSGLTTVSINPNSLAGNGTPSDPLRMNEEYKPITDSTDAYIFRRESDDAQVYSVDSTNLRVKDFQDKNFFGSDNIRDMAYEAAEDEEHTIKMTLNNGNTRVIRNSRITTRTDVDGNSQIALPDEVNWSWELDRIAVKYKERKDYEELTITTKLGVTRYFFKTSFLMYKNSSYVLFYIYNKSDDALIGSYSIGGAFADWDAETVPDDQPQTMYGLANNTLKFGIEILDASLINSDYYYVIQYVETELKGPREFNLQFAREDGLPCGTGYPPRILSNNAKMQSAFKEAGVNNSYVINYKSITNLNTSKIFRYADRVFVRGLPYNQALPSGWRIEVYQTGYRKGKSTGDFNIANRPTINRNRDVCVRTSTVNSLPIALTGVTFSGKITPSSGLSAKGKFYVVLRNINKNEIIRVNGVLDNQCITLKTVHPSPDSTWGTNFFNRFWGRIVVPNIINENRL